MHYSRHYLQDLEAKTRKALRKVAEAEAKEAGSHKTRKTPPVDLGSRHRAHRSKSYELGS